MTQKKNLSTIMRNLHRDIGFLLIGFIIVYAFSGIVMTYRNTNFLKQDSLIEKKLQPGAEASELANLLKMKEIKFTEIKGDTLLFNNGYYNSSTGEAVYTVKEVISPFDKFIVLHKSSGDKPVHWINILFGALLLFLSISSFWMYKKESKLFRRGNILAVTGIVLAVLIVFLLPK